MSTIAVQDARSLYKTMLVDLYKEYNAPTDFLRSFFPGKQYATKNLSIEVRRNGEKIAVDVALGSHGNRNQWSRSTQKIFAPAYYREWYDITDMDIYDTLFGSSELNDGLFAQFLEESADKLQEMKDKIDRSYELQCSQVLHDGIIELKGGINVDFKRKAGSLVDLGAPQYWTNAGHDIYKDFENAGDFLRKEGKIQGGTINAILGGDAWNEMLKNTVFLTRNDLKSIKIDDISGPARLATGAVLHGQISAGSYTFNIFTYPQWYEDANNNDVLTPYIDPTKVIFIPEKPQFKLAHAAVPQLIKPGSPIVAEAYVISKYVDERESAEIIDLKSCGLAIPTAVDQIYTVKVKA